MNIEDCRNYCLSKKGSTESFPFDSQTLVFKVCGKMFALIGLERFPHSLNLKCDPEYALNLRDNYDGVTPGYHMNKKHWNTVLLDSDVADHVICDLIDHSYDLVVSGLPQQEKKYLSSI